MTIPISSLRHKDGMVIVMVADPDGTETDSPDDAVLVWNEEVNHAIARVDYPDLKLRIWSAPYSSGDTPIVDVNSLWVNSTIYFATYVDGAHAVEQALPFEVADADTDIVVTFTMGSPQNWMLGIASILRDPTLDDAWTVANLGTEKFEYAPGDPPGNDFDQRIVGGRFLTGWTWSRLDPTDIDIGFAIELSPPP